MKLERWKAFSKTGVHSNFIWINVWDESEVSFAEMTVTYAIILQRSGR
jgi:hypothetical protein